MTVNALQMNLVALQRQDRAISAITETSPQVTLYRFDASQKQWSRTEIEGSLFICERTNDPRCCLIILNKKDPRNHKESLTKSFELQVQDKFLLYKVPNGAVYGLWFYDERECSRVATSLQKFINGMKSRTPSKKQVPATRNGENASPVQRKPSSNKPVAQRNGQNGSSILTMLTQAQQRYDEDRKRQHSPTSQSSPPQENPMNGGGKFIFSEQSDADKSAPVIQISNGNGKSIKILQRPNKESPDDSVVPTTASNNNSSSSTPFSPLSNRMCPSQPSLNQSEPKSDNGSLSPMSSVEDNNAITSPFTPIKSQELSPSGSSNNLSLTFASNLLTPELLTMSISDHDNLLNSQNTQQATPNTSSKDTLLSPDALLGSHSHSTTSLPSMVGVHALEYQRSESTGAMSPASSSPVNSGLLSRDQLRSALITLIQSDDDLVTKLHEAYVKRCVLAE